MIIRKQLIISDDKNFTYSNIFTKSVDIFKFITENFNITIGKLSLSNITFFILLKNPTVNAKFHNISPSDNYNNPLCH